MTTTSSTRRSFLLAAASAAAAGACPDRIAEAAAATATHDRFAALEARTGGRLGVAALNTGTGAEATHRAGERFAFCSTFKVLAAAAILRRSAGERGLLDRRIPYMDDEIEPYSPITKQHVGEGITVAELCAAALQYSDNTAANLMIRLLGGPHAVTAFARSIGDNEFRLDRWETALNTAVPGDPRDTTTPAAMVRDLQRLMLGDLLGAPERDRLIGWMRGNTTGAARIRAAVPAGWPVADKTGSGDYGATNDIGVIWPPGRLPIVLVIYFTQRHKMAKPRDDVIAAATKIAIETIA